MIEPTRSTDAADVHPMYGRADGDNVAATGGEGVTPPPPRRRFTTYGSLGDGSRDYYGPDGAGSDRGVPRRSSWHPQRSPENVRRKFSFGTQDWQQQPQQQRPPAEQPQRLEQPQRPPREEQRPPFHRAELEKRPPTESSVVRPAPLEHVVPEETVEEVREKAPFRHGGRSLPPPPPITSSQLLAGASIVAEKKPPETITRAPALSLTSSTPLDVAKKPAQKSTAPVGAPPVAAAELPPSPLTCAALGGPETVARAEKAVQQLSELVSNNTAAKVRNI